MEPWAVKICKTCGNWSEIAKGQCTLTEYACGQFWRCSSWRPPREEPSFLEALSPASGT